MAKQIKSSKLTAKAITKASKEQRDIIVSWTDWGVPETERGVPETDRGVPETERGVPETERQILSVIKEEDVRLASVSEMPDGLAFADVDEPKGDSNVTLTDHNIAYSEREPSPKSFMNTPSKAELSTQKFSQGKSTS